MNKFSKEFYDRYIINVTDYKSLLSLAMATFTSNFYDHLNENTEIKMVKGGGG